LGVKPVAFAVTCRTEGMEPLEGLTLIQLALVEVVKESPATEEARLIVCAAGTLPPAVAEKLKLAGVAR
jgi:hypothetical protein